jgi:hypothetical protein
MRWLVIATVLLGIVGCGGESEPVAKHTPTPTPKPKAAEVVFLYRVQGDDPLPDSVSLRADGTADVRRGGGHGGFRTVAVVLPQAAAAHAMRLAEHAPWKALDGRTVTPGGFGGWDNDTRYMIRRGRRSITVTDAQMPRSIRPLITSLNAVIEGDVGHQVSSELHSAVSGTVAP